MGERECERWERSQRDRNGHAHANAREHRRLPTRRAMNLPRQCGDERIAREHALAKADAVIVRFAGDSLAPAVKPSWRDDEEDE
jgi:hypothetical protein